MTHAAPRLVASDLDGTLLGPDGRLSARTRAALGAVSRAGVPFVAVTARAPRSLQPLAGARGTVVCANGAITVDLGTAAVLVRHTLDAGDAVTALVGAVGGVALAAELSDGTLAHEVGYSPSRPWPGSPRSRTRLLAEPVLKVVAHVPGADPDDLLAAARAAVGGLAAVTGSSAAPFVELGPAGVDKATGLAAVCAHLGVTPSAVVAFGDMPNDVPMLAWAGRGVAVAHAHPAVLAVADEVAPRGDDGVAAVLERWFGRA